jgi:hypothetical protein
MGVDITGSGGLCVRSASHNAGAGPGCGRFTKKVSLR